MENLIISGKWKFSTSVVWHTVVVQMRRFNKRIIQIAFMNYILKVASEQAGLWFTKTGIFFSLHVIFSLLWEWAITVPFITCCYCLREFDTLKSRGAELSSLLSECIMLYIAGRLTLLCLSSSYGSTCHAHIQIHLHTHAQLLTLGKFHYSCRCSIRVNMFKGIIWSAKCPL